MQENFGFIDLPPDKNNCYPSSHAFGLHMLGLPISRSAIDTAIGRQSGQPVNFENRVRGALFLNSMGLDITYITSGTKRPVWELAKVDIESAYREVMSHPNTWPGYTIDMYREEMSIWQKYDASYAAAMSMGHIASHNGMMTPELAASYLTPRSPYDAMKPGAYIVAAIGSGSHVIAITEHPRYRDAHVLYTTGHGVIPFCKPYGIKDIFRNLNVIQDHEHTVVRLRSATEPTRERDDAPPTHEY